MSARKQIITNLLKEQKHSLDISDLDSLCEKTDGECRCVQIISVTMKSTQVTDAMADELRT